MNCLWATQVRENTQITCLEILSSKFLVVGCKKGFLSVVDINFGAILKNFVSSIDDILTITVL